MKSKIFPILIVVIMFFAVLFVVVSFSDIIADIENSMSSTSSGGSSQNNNTNEEDEDMSLLMTMQDPLYRSPVEGVDGIRFPVKYSNYFKEKVLNEDGVTLHCLIVPTDLLQQAGIVFDGTPVDYVKVIEDAGIAHLIIDGSDDQASNDAGNGNWIGYFGLTNIKTENTNRDMFAIAYVQYVNGVREYAGLPLWGRQRVRQSITQPHCVLNGWGALLSTFFEKKVIIMKRS